MVIDLTKEDELRLKNIAALAQRPEADIAREAMHWFLSDEQSHSELVAQSRQAIEQGVRSITKFCSLK